MSEEEVKINGKLLKELKVSELKYVCKERNLPSSGNKGALVKRLKAAIELEKLQRAARNSPACETLPNSDIAENSGENDFIKQYMENQRKLLRSSRFSSTSEADSEDDASSQKSGTVVSPLLGRRTRRSTKEGNDSSELETTNKTEDQTSGVQATVKSTQEEVRKKTRREVVKSTKDEEVSQNEEPAPEEAAESLPVIQEENPQEEQIQQKVNGEEDAEKQEPQVMEVQESEISEPQHIREKERSTKNVNIEDVTEGSKEPKIQESSNEKPEVHRSQPGDVPECEKVDEDQGMQKSRGEEKPSVTDSQEGATILQEQESQVVQEEHHGREKFEMRDQETKSGKENEKQNEDMPTETFCEPRQIVDAERQKEDRQRTGELQEASKEEIITEETIVDVDEIVNQEEELDYDEIDAPSHEKSEAAAQKLEDGDYRPVKGRRLRLKKDKKERKRSRTDSQKHEEKMEDEGEVELVKEQSRKRGKSSASQAAKQKDEEKTPAPFERKIRKRIKRKSLEAKSEMIEPEQTEVKDDASDAVEITKAPDEKIDEPEEKALEQEETVPEPEPRIPFRRISLNKSRGVSGDAKPRKRKWGGKSTDNINISSDLIKDLIDVTSDDIRKAMNDREEPGELIEEEEEEADEIIDITMEEPGQDAENDLGSTDQRTEKRTKRSKEGEEDGEIVEEEEVMVEELEENESEGEEGLHGIVQHDNRKVVSSKSQRTVEEIKHKVVSRSDQKRSLKEGSDTAFEKKKDSSRKKSSKTNVTVTNKSGPKEPTPPPQPREVSPSRYDPSKILHVRNLVRPFTVNQLQALFGKLGKVTEGSFWIDKIKSHCLITYESAEDAINARKCIHGINWPSSNPKQLAVDFCEQSRADGIKGIVLDKPIPSLMGDWNTEPKSKSEAEEKTRKDETRSRRSAPDDGQKSEGKNQMDKNRDRERHEKDDQPRRRSSPKGADRRKDSSRDKDRRRSPERRRREDKRRGARKEEITKPLREWDRDKLDQEVEHRRQLKEHERERRSPQRNERREARDRKQKEEPKTDEQPAKLLDDLFRKTKATPCIYWLPLTDKQLAQRIKEREERREARNKIRREMEEEESRNRAKMAAEKKDRGARSPDRRRPSDRLRRDSTSDRRPERKPAERTGSRGSGERASLTRKKSPKAGGGEKPPAKSSSDSSSSNSSSGSESDSDSDSSSDSSPKKK